MTTDELAQAEERLVNAREYAGRWWFRPASVQMVEEAAIEVGRLRALAVLKDDPDVVERMAQADHDYAWKSAWEDVDEETRELFRDVARVILAAALSTARSAEARATDSEERDGGL